MNAPVPLTALCPRLPARLRNGLRAPAQKKGFALIATISVMVLMVMVALAMLSLSTLESRQKNASFHQARAKANARLALMIAIGELQKSAGPDQRVTARAAILESPGSAAALANRNWLGVWATTVESGGRQWPVIGKAVADEAAASPYSRPGAYEDLRHTRAELAGGAWKNTLRRTWLVSKRSAVADATSGLNPDDDHVVEIVGKGTLGKNLGDAQYLANRVLVEKVDVLDKGEGAYAWYISDNNQKACIDPLDEVDLAEAAFEASPRDNPELVQTDGTTPFSGFTEKAKKHPGKMLTYRTAPLTQGDPAAAGEVLGKHYHHFATYCPGLFTNTLAGGLRKDLTPLLLADSGKKTIRFSLGQAPNARGFSSSYPIIPGPGHGVLGPSFGALRNWAQHAYTDLEDAETQFGPAAVRMRPTLHWPHNISDGACAEASEWAESAPKIHPVMTDCRWHYYFSHHRNRIRTHIIPRVCLWNPYNRELKTPELTVLMPNPFYRLSHAIHFFPENEHVEELRDKYPGSIFSEWVKKRGYTDGAGNPKAIYKLRVNPFPQERFLAFVLAPASLGAGECQVFSPKVTVADAAAGSVRVQKYRPANPASNVLSSSADPAKDHFIYDHKGSVSYQVQTPSWKKIQPADLDKIDFGRIFDYWPYVDMQTPGRVESFPFILKAGASASLDTLYTSESHPTLQLVNNAAGGAHATTTFAMQGDLWGSALQGDDKFGSLETFQENPEKDAPGTHQVGAKLLWLDESATEANRPPLRHGTSRKTRWVPDHMVYNVCPIANWNVRAQLTTRSPASQCGKKYYLNSLGPWLLQFAPFSPQNVNDLPPPNASGAYVKNPFGSVTTFGFNIPSVILFDLPSKDYGVLSMARLRHAMLTPYSWHPSYIVGHSLRDLHAPADYSAHEVAVAPYGGSAAPTRWDYLLGAYKGSLKHGAHTKASDSQGLLQIGDDAVSRSVNGVNLSSKDEILAYDIAYEVNYNLWDRFFISGMPLDKSTQAFDWNPGRDKPLWNTRYQFNPDCGTGFPEVASRVSSAAGLDAGFWSNAVWLKNKAAFNVNSTSVKAWTAYLSGLLGEKRLLKSGETAGDAVSFTRHNRPSKVGDTSAADPGDAGGWIGGRRLSDDELRTLAEKIVDEVRKRGPFVSLADFVNRRLRDSTDDTSHMGTLDAAIDAAGLNANFEKYKEYATTAVNRGTDPASEDNNLGVFKDSYRYDDGGYVTFQPASQAWGLPGFLTQADLLVPLSASLSVRGDTFTVRAYGESSAAGVVKARAWLEATVERGPLYLHTGDGSGGARGNSPTDTALILNNATGQYQDGKLSDENKTFGRKFIVKSIRWLSAGEI